MTHGPNLAKVSTKPVRLVSVHDIKRVGITPKATAKTTSGTMQSIVWKTPLQQDLADNIARGLAPQTAQPVLLRKLPTTTGQEGASGGLIRISTGHDSAPGGYATQMRPETALEVRVTKVELCSHQGNQRRPSLSLEAEVVLLRSSDGQELCAWPVRRLSHSTRWRRATRAKSLP